MYFTTCTNRGDNVLVFIKLFVFCSSFLVDSHKRCGYIPANEQHKHSTTAALNTNSKTATPLYPTEKPLANYWLRAYAMTDSHGCHYQVIVALFLALLILFTGPWYSIGKCDLLTSSSYILFKPVPIPMVWLLQPKDSHSYILVAHSLLQ